MPSQPIKIKLHGFEKFRANLEVLRENVKRDVVMAINEMALEMEAKAKEYCPVDMGQLRASIRTRFFKEPMVSAFVECTASYGNFIEYGTGLLGMVSVPRKGPFPAGYQPSTTRKQPPIDLILAWVQRKGLTMSGVSNQATGQKQLAFLIARHIGQYGTKAHPFMYPAYLDMRPKFKTNVFDAINRGQKRSKITKQRS